MCDFFVVDFSYLLCWSLLFLFLHLPNECVKREDLSLCVTVFSVAVKMGNPTIGRVNYIYMRCTSK